MNSYIKHFIELTTLELYAILELRSTVFVLEQNCVYLDIDGVDKTAHHLLIWENDILVGTTRIITNYQNNKSYASIGRVCSHIDFRSKKIGKNLMPLSIDFCKKTDGIKTIKITAQNYLLAFYQSFNFVAKGEIFLEDNIPHIAMELAL